MAIIDPDPYRSLEVRGVSRNRPGPDGEFVSDLNTVLGLSEVPPEPTAW